ncbi:MAG TPA: precorrin-3B C(17)-methyltransferase [Candidatus Dietzia intestinipullorum]|nr:precorrin-3B C(17)-methyltransferase [Candidatus Dietzia intestinipullorum]
MSGTLYGVGLGPGDPDLVTVRAARVIEEADVVAFHAARHGRSIARATASSYMSDGQIEELLVYPLTVEETDHPGGYEAAIEEFYAEAAERLAAHLRAGRDVALCAAGDPLFYSSFMHMYIRLADEFTCDIVPGVTAVSAVSAAVARPLVEGEEVLTVLPGTLDEATLTERLAGTDSAVVMKLGRTFDKVRRAATAAGRLEETRYVERATWSAQKVVPLAEVEDGTVPYFSAAVIPSPEDARRRVAGVPGATAGTPIDDERRPQLTVIGTGPGPAAWRTPEVDAALRTATDVVGYETYTRRIPPLPGRRVHASDNRVELERATFALDLARAGRRVVVVSGGDPGVFAMAAAVFEAAEAGDYTDVEIAVLPGVTAASAVAARAGAPLGHDFAMLSLSDRLKPWDVVEDRVRALVAADLAVAVYNPASRSRREQVVRLRELLLDVAGADRVVVVGRDVGGPDESLCVTTAGEFDPSVVDMRTLLVIGSSRTRVVATPAGRRAYTPRSY